MPTAKYVPIHPTTLSWSTETLIDHFLNPTELPKLQMHGALADRSKESPQALALLKQEALSPENRAQKFFGFIKVSWSPIMAILDHGQEESKKELKNWIQVWTAEERQDFLQWIQKEAELTKYFKE